MLLFANLQKSEKPSVIDSSGLSVVPDSPANIVTKREDSTPSGEEEDTQACYPESSIGFLFVHLGV